MKLDEYTHSHTMGTI